MMHTGEADARLTEFDRWMTLERIAYSDLAEVIFTCVKEGGCSPNEMTDLFVAVIDVFANGCCFYLASAIASITNWPILGLWRTDPSMPLVHCVIVDPTTGLCHDILGRAGASEVRQQLIEVIGPLRTTTVPSVHPEMDPDELRLLLDITKGLPWMPNYDPAYPLSDWRHSVLSYAAARHDQRP